MADFMPDSDIRRSLPDWWARLFAVGGLAVGAAALYYSWIHTTNLPTTQEIVASYHTELSQILQKTAEDERERLDLLAEKATKDRDANEWLALQERNAQVERWLASLNATTPSGSDDDTEADTEMAIAATDETGEPVSSDTVAATTAATSGTLLDDLFGLDDYRKSLLESGELAARDGSRLQIVRRTLRPANAADAEISAITNTTDIDAAVDTIEFIPKSLYKVSSDASSGSASLEATDLDIRFQPTDNRAHDPGKQGTYRRVFAEPIAVPAGSQTNIRVQVQDSRHLGWGMRGRLVLVYGDRRLEIPSVSARFVAQP